MGLVALSIRWSMRALCVLFLVLAGDAFPGEGQMLRIPVREGVVPVFWLPQESTASAPDAPATWCSFPAATVRSASSTRAVGRPQATFLFAAALFAAYGFNLAMVAKPSDLVGLIRCCAVADGTGRPAQGAGPSAAVVGRAALAGGDQPGHDLRGAAGDRKAKAAVTAAAASLPGVVLTSSITSNRIANTVPRLDLDRIRVPVLVMHHAQDACFARADETANIIVDGPTNAPVRKLLIVDGGGRRSATCRARGTTMATSAWRRRRSMPSRRHGSVRRCP